MLLPLMRSSGSNLEVEKAIGGSGLSYWALELEGMKPHHLPLAGGRVTFLIREVFLSSLLVNLKGKECYLKPLRMMPRAL